jgi:hypothetical protein
MITGPILLIPLVAFWAIAIKLWTLDGPRIPCAFIALWLAAYLAMPRLHWPRLAFVAIECLLAAILIIVERYKSKT